MQHWPRDDFHSSNAAGPACPAASASAPPVQKLCDKKAAVASLAAAFADDPIFAYIFPNEADRARRMLPFFSVWVPSILRGADAYSARDDGAVAIWRAPGAHHSGILHLLRDALPYMRSLGGNLIRALRVSHAIERNFPVEPQFYLHMLGASPVVQGQGLGGALLRHGLERVDAQHQSCWLETTNPANLGMYMNFGFDIVREHRIQNGPNIWFMQRPPQL